MAGTFFPRKDNDALHDNVAGEIVALASKAVPGGSDVIVIEDAAAANAKKKVTLQSAFDALGSTPSAFNHTAETYAELIALTPEVGEVAWPADSDASHLMMVCRDPGEWQTIMPAWGRVQGLDILSSATGWSWDNQGGATATHDTASLHLETTASAGLDIHSYKRALPAAPWVFGAVFDMDGGTGRSMGLMLRESSTGEIYRFGQSLDTITSGLCVYHNTSATAGTSTKLLSSLGVGAAKGSNLWHLRIEGDGAGGNIRFIARNRTGHETLLLTLAWAADMAGGPNEYGFHIASTGSVGRLDVYSFEEP